MDARARRGNYLTYGPSMKSVKKVCAKVKEQTLSIFKPVKNEEVVQRVNVLKYAPNFYSE